MKGKALYIEDNEEARLLMRRVLDYLDIELEEAESAEEGIEKIKTAKPDIILMDIQLPGINGYDAAKLIKGEPETSEIPVIGVTATAQFQDREKALEAGCDNYLTKPYTLDELKEAISDFLEL